MTNFQNTDKPLIIWIDQNINNLENQNYLLQLGYSNVNMNSLPSEINYIPQNEKNLSYDIQVYDNVNESIQYITSLRFKDTIIIISGGLFNDFIGKLYQRLKDIYIIPYIIVFTSRQKNFSILNERYFKFVGVETKFERVKKIINQYIEQFQIFNQLDQFDLPMKIPFEDKLIFEEIRDKKMILLPLFYKNFLEESNITNNEFIEILINTYKNEPKYTKLFDLIKIKNIPVQLLCKYYARIYTVDGNFFRVMKTDLLSDNYERQKLYIPFIKTLYDGLKEGALKKCYERELYSAQNISPQEIQNLIRSKQNRLPGLPMSIVFSKSFLSFTKSKNVAEDFYNNYNKNAMFTVKNTSQESKFLAHADIEELSCFDYEKEVLFFPFCAFGIDKFEIHFDPVKNNNRYEIELIYLGQYKYIYDKIDNKDELIPNTKFKQIFEKSGLANEKVKNAKIKNLSAEEEIKKEKKCKTKLIVIFVIVTIVIVGVIVLISQLAEKKSSKTISSTKVDSNLKSYTEGSIECEPGYYLENDKKICSVCLAGTYSKKGAKECIKCPNGTYSNFNGASLCEECPEGTIPNNEKTSCIDCPVGTYSNIKGASKCIPCPINTFSDKQGATECKNCDSSFCSNPGSESCYDC